MSAMIAMYRDNREFENSRWRACGCLLSGLLLATFSTQAQAPAPSQEFWNYLVEFGDAQGNVFDPSDFAAVANIPAKAQQEAEKLSNDSKSNDVSREMKAAQEQSR